MSASHYERIAQVIRYLDAHHAEQPGLAVLAAQLGLNPFHFHRLFSVVAGSFKTAISALTGGRPVRCG